VGQAQVAEDLIGWDLLQQLEQDERRFFSVGFVDQTQADDAVRMQGGGFAHVPTLTQPLAIVIAP
jgi:hypothetical protein